MQDLFLIDLDVAFNDGEELSGLAEIMKKYNVEVYDIDPTLNGNGHPCITFKGIEEDIIKLGAYLLDDNDEDFIRSLMRILMN